MKQNKVLFIGLVWPEPTSSAAGKRIIQLVEFFLNRGDQVIFSSAAAKSESSFDFSTLRGGTTSLSLRKTDSLSLGGGTSFTSLRGGTTKQSQNLVTEFPIELNSSSFNDFIQKLQPDIVVYDRFVSEEQFGWRVREVCPNALQILDTEDLHFLRAARQKAFKKSEEVDLYNETTYREIASLLRCDLNWMISEAEIDLLTNQFNLSKTLFQYVPFLEEEISTDDFNSYQERKDFVFIGNFLHEPNWQTVLKLKKEIWPRIRKEIPTSKLHIYGAYPAQKVWDLQNEKEGFLVHGKAENAKQVIAQARVLLAPLPFGAGQKGKFIDAMQVGTPIATNSIGAEGMFVNEIPGIQSDDLEDFVQKTIELYSNENLWTKSQELGVKIHNEKFQKEMYYSKMDEQILFLQANLEKHRQQNILGKILQQTHQNALKYMSLWIEEKNKK